MKKKLNPLIVILVTLFILPAYSFAQQNVGIGTDSPDQSAKLEVNANDKGILIPRLSSAQRSAIVAPANGLLLYDTDTKSFWFYSDTSWKNMADVSAWKLDGNIADPYNFIGTTNATPLTFKVNYEKVGFLDASNVYWGNQAGDNYLIPVCKTQLLERMH